MDLRKLAKKAKGLVDDNGDKIAKAVDKGTDLVDKKTKGKYSAKLDKLDDLAEKLDKTTPAEEAGNDEQDRP
jgi:hypothetical protein